MDQSLLIHCSFLAAVSGLAWLIRSDKPLTLRLIFATALSSGSFGWVIVHLFTDFYPDRPNLVIGVCGLAGIGGTETVNFVAVTLPRLIKLFVLGRFGVNLDEADKSDKDQSKNASDKSDKEQT